MTPKELPELFEWIESNIIKVGDEPLNDDEKKKIAELVSSQYSERTCEWKFQENNDPPEYEYWWKTGCGSVSEIKAIYCPYCGGKIVEKG